MAWKRHWNCSFGGPVIWNCRTHMRTTPLAALLLLAGPVVAGESSLIRFDLKDQFERGYTDRTFRGKPMVIFGGGKEGGRFCPSWSRAVSLNLPAEAKLETPMVALIEVPGV